MRGTFALLIYGEAYSKITKTTVGRFIILKLVYFCSKELWIISRR